MHDRPQLLRPDRQIASHSPTRLPPPGSSARDDFFRQLAPLAAVGSLTHPTGSLRTCLENASASERDFAMRAAVASNMIWGWVQELSDWTWPAYGGSAGFRQPGARGADGDYIGSLPAKRVLELESRIDQIHRDVAELEVEDIKSHVMTDHILPLSRPGTPMSAVSSGTSSSVGYYNKMEDLSAVVTVIVVQTLPNLAKLSQLLQTWSTRLLVLERIPRLLIAIENAETALASGWNALTAPAKDVPSSASEAVAKHGPLSREDFRTMKNVIEKEVDAGGRVTDYMLDCLEGQSDTLPNEWLDRLEAVEKDYTEWVFACEQHFRKNEWLRLPMKQRLPEPISPLGSSKGIQVEVKDGNQEEAKIHDRLLSSLGHTTPEHHQSKDADAHTSQVGAVSNTSYSEEKTSEKRQVAAMVRRLEEKAQDHSAGPSPTLTRSKSPRGRPRKAISPRKLKSLSQALAKSRGYEDHARAVSGFDSTGRELLNSGALASALPIVSSTTSKQVSRIIDSDDEDDNSVLDEEEMELPPLPNDTRRNSDASDASIIIHGASSQFHLSSDLPEVSASPDIPRKQVRKAQYVTNVSRSSPQLPEDQTPGTFDHDSDDHTTKSSRTVKQQQLSRYDRAPSMEPLYETDDYPRNFTHTPPEGSFAEDFNDSLSVSERATANERKLSAGDDQLRQQISQIIQDIPARIKLSGEAPNVNLNPPDLKLPKMRRKPSEDRFRRSGSAISSRSTVSSRSVTPAFTLSPAKNARPRANRTQQEIKVYHLSGSNGEAPIKLFIRCVGEQGERVMVRVGGGWADLSEYLKDYASHHKRRPAVTDSPKIEVKVPRAASAKGISTGSSPPSRPDSALDSPQTPLYMRKARRSTGAQVAEVPRLLPKTPSALNIGRDDPNVVPRSEESARPGSSSHLSWVEDDSSFLGLAGPSGKRVEMSEEHKAWVESVTQKVRLASGETRDPQTAVEEQNKGRFGELGKVGGTTRLFRRGEDIRKS